MSAITDENKKKLIKDQLKTLQQWVNHWEKMLRFMESQKLAPTQKRAKVKIEQDVKRWKEQIKQAQAELKALRKKPEGSNRPDIY